MKRKKIADKSDELVADNLRRKKLRSSGGGQTSTKNVENVRDLQLTPVKGNSGRKIAANRAANGQANSPGFSVEGERASESDAHSSHGSGDIQSNNRLPLGRKTGQASGSRIDKKLLSTPTKGKSTLSLNDTHFERHVNRSARRKSTRTLIERAVLGHSSDNDGGDEDIAQQIYQSEEDELAQDGTGEEEEPAGEALGPETPTKRGRGRPKGSKNKQRSPTPPQDLPPHELYFFQNRGGRLKTSNNNLSSIALLDHDEYFNLLRQYKDPHAKDIAHLEQLHSGSFGQWQFELDQNFNICIYGWGSKRDLLMKFADYIYKTTAPEMKSKIVIVNGYVHSLTIRDIMNAVAAAISEQGQKLGSQPNEMLENLWALLEDDLTLEITLIIHSIDRPPLRRAATQTILSRLASHPQISLVASADHHSFPLLWDSSLRSAYNFLFHDCTTFRPFAVEVDVVEEVHELLGRSGRRVGGKEGVSFVLKSLPENAKNLFRVLVSEQLAVMEDNGAPAFDQHDEDDDDDDDRGRAAKSRSAEVGIEYSILYQKAVEDFICSNEMNFRTLLKEFHDHQMIESRKDALGTEILSVPFRKEELETILADIIS